MSIYDTDIRHMYIHTYGYVCMIEPDEASLLETELA